MKAIFISNPQNEDEDSLSCPCGLGWDSEACDCCSDCYNTGPECQCEGF